MTIRISYVSDVLCVWAYVAEARLDQLRRDFGTSIALSYHFIPIFGATRYRIAEGWKDRGGYRGFGEHVRKVAKDFPHVSVHEHVWSEVAPRSSSSAHEVLHAVKLLASEGKLDPEPQQAFEGRTIFEEATWRVRRAFFEEARDISSRAVLLELLEALNVPVVEVQSKLDSGEAMAELCRDIELRDKYKIEGSPTFSLNRGRQKLYGNVGYRVVSANLRELLEKPGEQASWC